MTIKTVNDLIIQIHEYKFQVFEYSLTFRDESTAAAAASRMQFQHRVYRQQLSTELTLSAI